MKTLQRNISLREISNFKIGGRAKHFLDFKNIDELRQGLEEWNEIVKTDQIDSKKYFIIGGATNILFDDDIFPGLILKNSIDFISKDGNKIEIGAGTSIQKVVDYCIQNSLSGFEWAGGLPGTIGGAIFGNAGAFGGQIDQNILSVKSYDLTTGKIIERSKKECSFGYRSSIFKSNFRDEAILSAVFTLKAREKEEIKKDVMDKIEYRQRRQPLELPNIGSVFKNISLSCASQQLAELCREKIKDDPFPVIPVGYLIYLAGLQGKRIGDAQISLKHPNFIVNLGSAKASDVEELIILVKKNINQKFDIEIETEIIRV